MADFLNQLFAMKAPEIPGQQPDLGQPSPVQPDMPPVNPLIGEMVSAQDEMRKSGEDADSFTKLFMKGLAEAGQGPEKLTKGQVARNALANFARANLMGPNFRSVEQEAYERRMDQHKAKMAQLGMLIQAKRAQSAEANNRATQLRLMAKDAIDAQNKQKLADLREQELKRKQTVDEFEQWYKGQMLPVLTDKSKSEISRNQAIADSLQQRIESAKQAGFNNRDLAVKMTQWEGKDLETDPAGYAQALVRNMKAISEAQAQPRRPIPPTLVQVGGIGPEGERITQVVPVDRYTGQPVNGGTTLVGSNPATAEARTQQNLRNEMMFAAQGLQSVSLGMAKSLRDIVGPMEGSKPLAFYRSKMEDGDYTGLEAAFDRVRTDSQQLLQYARTGKQVNELEVKQFETMVPQKTDSVKTIIKKSIVFNLAAKAWQWRIDRAREEGVNPDKAIREFDVFPSIIKVADKVADKAVRGGEVNMEELDPDNLFARDWAVAKSRINHKPAPGNSAPTPGSNKKEDLSKLSEEELFRRLVNK